MTTTSTAEALATITAKQAAKRVGTLRFIIERAIGEGQLSAIAYKRSYLLNVKEVDRWFANLTPAVRATVVPCARRGCYCEEDKWPHDPSTITHEGHPKHGRTVADSDDRETSGMATRVLTRVIPDGGWRVGLRAVGDADWEIYVEVTAKSFPVAERGYYRATFPVPDSPGLAEAITEAIRVRDQLNSELHK